MEIDAQPQKTEPTKWYPLNVQTEEEMRAYDALRDELPVSIEQQFWQWVRNALLKRGESGISGTREEVSMDPLSRRVREFTINYPFNEELFESMAIDFDFSRSSFPFGVDDEEILDKAMDNIRWYCDPFVAADYLLAHGNVDQESADRLEYYLKRARVNWMVGMRHGKPGLVRRIPDGISDAADRILEGADKSASEYLAEAWSKFYSHNQELPAAYGNAIKAVEAALKPLIAPNDTMSTLGKILSTVRNQEWELSASRTDQKVSSHDVLKAMISQLWAGQLGRHGGNSEDKPLSESDVAVALGLAFSIVHFANEDALRRGKQEKKAAS